MLEELKNLIERAKERIPFYRERLKDVDPSKIKALSDLKYIPFTTKEDLRERHFEDFLAVPEEEVVRIHSTSGTTGRPVIIAYTKRDVEDWTEMMVRSLRLAGVTPKDRIQITPGYGLWTAGIGFQSGAEALGAWVIPMGPGNTERQIEYMMMMKTTVITGTASYGLFLAEEINRRGLRDRLHLRKGIFGAEIWGDKRRKKIEELLGIESFDIYGMTEVYGPGIGIDCQLHEGIHYWSDYLVFEVIDPSTGDVLPPGEEGEIVITTLRKEAMPLIRFRTRDIGSLIPEPCKCGFPFPRISRIRGRTDDVITFKGVKILPSLFEEVISAVDGVDSEYEVHLYTDKGMDKMLVRVEINDGRDPREIERELEDLFRKKAGVKADFELLQAGTLPRYEKKAKRIIDRREQ
ncbi:MAG: phenylacetate--CoA ligase [Synergistetes bacterium]|nr:phenylacetate--CoA ligase [Synergistota bacterium]MDW8191692.1 phenylacetate--CoA ligase [Synergistota bacterium]